MTDAEILRRVARVQKQNLALQDRLEKLEQKYDYLTRDYTPSKFIEDDPPTIPSWVFEYPC